MIIAIDFDGTIVDHEYPEIGKLKKNVQRVLRRIKDDGHDIIIWTVRSKVNDAISKAVDALHVAGIEYTCINDDAPQVKYEWGWADFSRKIYADVYIDDRNLGGLPDDWEEIYSILLKHPDYTKAHKSRVDDTFYRWRIKAREQGTVFHQKKFGKETGPGKFVAVFKENNNIPYTIPAIGLSELIELVPEIWVTRLPVGEFPATSGELKVVVVLTSMLADQDLYDEFKDEICWVYLDDRWHVVVFDIKESIW